MASETLSREGANLQITLGNPSFPLPEATLSIAGGERTTFYGNEPIDVEVHATDSIQSVTYFIDDIITGVYKQAPFRMLFALQAGEKKSVSAKVVFTSRFEITTPPQSIEATLLNQPPSIQSIFPPSGSTWLKSDVTYLFVNASDEEGDSLHFILLDSGGDEIIAVEDPEPIPLKDVKLGSNFFTIRVQDSKYGFADQFYFLNFIEDGMQQIAQGSPLEADDDVEEKNDGTIDIEGDLDLGEKLVGIRFPTVGIPPGASIDSAYVQFTSQKAEQTGMATCEISVQQGIHTSPFQNMVNNLSSRHMLDTRVLWEMPDWLEVNEKSSLQRTPDLQSLLSDLVAQSGWTDTSRIQLFFQINGSESKRSAFSVDQVQEFAPQLIIHYRSDFTIQHPDPPLNFSFEQVSNTTGMLRWNGPDGTDILGFKIFVNDTTPLLANETELHLANLEQDIEYIVSGKTIGEKGAESILSDTFGFMLGTVSVNNAQHQFDISIWPNPSPGNLTIKFSQIQILPIPYKIHALNGQIVQEGVLLSDENSLDVREIPSGTYYLSVVDTGGNAQVVKWSKW